MTTSRPPRLLQKRRIYVSYVYERLCYHNPSYARFQEEPAELQRRLLVALRKRHAERDLRQKKIEATLAARLAARPHATHTDARLQP